MKKQLIFFIFFTFLNLTWGQEILWDSTFVVEKNKFQVISYQSKDGYHFSKLIQPKNDTIEIEGTSGGVDFLKLNNDEYPDITFSHLGNNYVAELFLYNPKTKSYKQVTGFNEVSDCTRLKADSNYYYAYHRAGCADANWMSILFYIDNFKVYTIGEIFGEGCPYDGSEGKIKVSKIITPDKIIKIETIDIEIINNYEDYKWGFIEEYWNTNYKKFKTQNSP